MDTYDVYEARFVTTEHTTIRFYIGSTCDSGRRERELVKDGDKWQPYWLQAGHDKFVFRFLAAGVAPKREALAREALETARRWSTMGTTWGQ